MDPLLLTRKQRQRLSRSKQAAPSCVVAQPPTRSVISPRIGVQLF
jgi:hypothetical protein